MIFILPADHGRNLGPTQKAPTSLHSAYAVEYSDDEAPDKRSLPSCDKETDMKKGSLQNLGEKSPKKSNPLLCSGEEPPMKRIFLHSNAEILPKRRKNEFSPHG